MKVSAWRRRTRRRPQSRFVRWSRLMIQFDFGVAPWDPIVMTYIQSLAARDGERILRFEDVDAFPDWNPRKKIRLERLVAEKPRE